MPHTTYIRVNDVRLIMNDRLKQEYKTLYSYISVEMSVRSDGKLPVGSRDLLRCASANVFADEV